MTSSLPNGSGAMGPPSGTAVVESPGAPPEGERLAQRLLLQQQGAEKAEEPRRLQIDTAECLKKGLIGSIGAVPATVASFPLDATKIRQQVSNSTLRPALQYVWSQGLYRGLFVGIQQKFLTRGPMFLCSAVSIQASEIYLGLDKTTSAFVGAAASGYITGFIAAPREWMKVLRTQQLRQPVPAHGGCELIKSALAESIRMGTGWSALKRMQAAGVRNGIFDSVFFGMQHVLSNRAAAIQRDSQSSGSVLSRLLTSQGEIYAASAITAATVDYIVDVAVKRVMRRGPEETVPGLIRHCVSMIRTESLVNLHRGLGIKTCEMGVSYYVTGFASTYIAYYFAKLLCSTEKQ